MQQDTAPELTPWPAGDDEMSSRMRGFDWGQTALGPPSAWPQPLKSAVEFILPVGFPMIILWGRDLIQIYNDAYRRLMGAKHPGGLGKPTQLCWSEVWHITEPIYERVKRGETVTLEDGRFPLLRGEEVEDAWFTASYSPLRDEAGAVAGVLVALFETTERVQAEAARLRIQSRQAFLLRLSDALRPLGDPREVQAAACRLAAEHLKGDRGYYAQLDHERQLFIVEQDHVVDGAYSVVGTHAFADFPQAMEALNRGRVVVCEDTEAWPDLSPALRKAYELLRIRAFVTAPLIKDGRPVASMTVASATPKAWARDAAQDLQEIGERTWEAVERARSEAALREKEHHQELLLAELQHRTRNMLAIIRSIASRTAETSDDIDTFMAHFQGRLSAMARTQTALSRSSDVSVSLTEILHDEFLAVAAHEDQVEIDGPEVRLQGKAAETLTLGLHELATNALKYGALTTPRGRVSVRWQVIDEPRPTLALQWRESGVPTLDLTPKRIGFGRRLIENALPYELGAETALRFAPGGVIAEIRLPLSTQG